MDNAAWIAEVKRRVAIDEGDEAKMYHDTKGVPTIGVGFNLRRADARTALERVGVPASDVDGVMGGAIALTQTQINALFEYSFAPVLSDARASLPDGIFDAMTDARRFVICDLVFNLGAPQWNGFGETIGLIAAAQTAKNHGAHDAHAKFVQAANHMRTLPWYRQTGDRSKRDCAMMQVGDWCNPSGNGSDILPA
ncbi:MAG TPA: hypothetical protein VKR56_03770 [Candidatus Cybelea sp.]|nr:hypothetical protein [Candidatus Cybelea sp.]